MKTSKTFMTMDYPKIINNVKNATMNKNFRCYTSSKLETGILQGLTYNMKLLYH